VEHERPLILTVIPPTRKEIRNMKLDAILDEIRKRFNSLRENSNEQRDFLANLKSLARWNSEPMDYPQVKDPAFPATINVAHAVCHPECGRQEFIVDGSTQKCQRCGGLMFRGKVVEYKRENH